MAREHLNTLDILKFIGHDGRHPWVLRVLACVIVRQLLIIFERSWSSGEVTED